MSFVGGFLVAGAWATPRPAEHQRCTPSPFPTPAMTDHPASVPAAPYAIWIRDRPRSTLCADPRGLRSPHFPSHRFPFREVQRDAGIRAEPREARSRSSATGNSPRVFQAWVASQIARRNRPPSFFRNTAGERHSDGIKKLRLENTHDRYLVVGTTTAHSAERKANRT